MNIDQEMKLWESRSNDEFGTILKQIREKAAEIVEDTREIMDNYIAIYSLDGEAVREYISIKVKNFLINYDLTGEGYEEFDNLVIELKKLA